MAKKFSPGKMPIICLLVSCQLYALENLYVMTILDHTRYIHSNGVPMAYGTFPNSKNPSKLIEQDYNFKMPLYPKFNKKITALSPYAFFGVASDGIPYNPGTNNNWHNDPHWSYEFVDNKDQLGMDFYNTHLQENGAYHYQGLPTELIIDQSPNEHSKMVGYAADGFPIYANFGFTNPKSLTSPIKKLYSSYQLRTGTRPSGPGGTYDGTFTQDYEYVANSGDLDECNGRFGVTPDYPDGTYYYFLTDEFPQIPRCFKGTPDPSFNKPTKDHEKPDW